MTALTHEVLKDMALPSGSPPVEPPKSIAEDQPFHGITHYECGHSDRCRCGHMEERKMPGKCFGCKMGTSEPIVDAMTPKDLTIAIGLGEVHAKVTDDDHGFVTQWDVDYSGTKIGHITRSRSGPMTFYAYSDIDPNVVNGAVKMPSIRSSVSWLLVHAREKFPFIYSTIEKLTKAAVVEESEIEGEDEMSASELNQFVSQAVGIHPRATELAGKVKAWLQKNNADWGVHIKIVKGREDSIRQLGHDWMSTDPSTILALELEYHITAFHLNYPVRNRFEKFLRKNNASLLKLDCTRWYVMEKSIPVKENMMAADLAATTEKPYFVPYKGIHTGDEGMALKIPFPEKITQEQWAKINRLMVQKGYDMRGAADSQRSVYGFLQKFGRNVIPPVLQPWIDTIALVLDVKAPSQSPDVKTAGATPASTVFRRAVKEWGITHDPHLAGYILPSGVMLDLSGGSGKRMYDHRQVGQFFEEDFAEQTDAMHAFMDLGAIRWLPENRSVDIRKPPTPRQLTALRYLMRSIQGKNFFVDVFWPDYGSSVAEYKPGTSPERIVRDIQTFYKTGELPGYTNPVAGVSAMAESAVDDLLRRTAGGAWEDDVKDVWYKLPESEAFGWFKDLDGPCIDFNKWVGNVGDNNYAVALATIDFENKEPGQKPTILFRCLLHTVPTGDIDWDSEDEVPPDIRAKAEREWAAYYQNYVYPALTKKLKESVAVKNVVHALLGEADEQLELPLDDDDGGSPMTPEEIGDWLSDIGITKDFKQIGGDRNAWEYGGTWFSAGIEANPNKWASIIHIDGLEGSEKEEYRYRDDEVKDKLAEPEWQARVQQVKAETYPDDEDNERAEDDVLTEIADQMNAAVEQAVYRTNAEDPAKESWIMNRINDVLSSLVGTREQWDEMEPQDRVDVAAQYFGWEEFDSYPEKMTRKALSAYLGIAL